MTGDDQPTAGSDGQPTAESSGQETTIERPVQSPATRAPMATCSPPPATTVIGEGDGVFLIGRPNRAEIQAPLFEARARGGG